MQSIRWGIIGCGDVTEVKSGPAFNKVDHSTLVAVMRRNAEKARDYADRHGVPRWYSDAQQLINDPEVNAIYVATPPSTHEAYTIMALEAGKPVYVEKPMSVNAQSARAMTAAAAKFHGKLVVAHYRRAQPFFRKIKQLIGEDRIGEARLARLELFKHPLPARDINASNWRIDPQVSGGGLFHDLSPHQLDLACFFFGSPVKASGFSLNQSGQYQAPDVTAGTILFPNGVVLSGTWSFAIGNNMERDRFEIIGTKGTIEFAVFGEPVIHLKTDKGVETIRYEPLQHVQQPMIANVVDYFRGDGPNPCPGDGAVEVMELISLFSGSASYSP